MTPAARTFKGSFLFCPRGQIPRARRGQTHAPFPAGVTRGRNGFRKDKGGEKLAETEEDLLQHRTDGTDAFDTLYIGCEKFPFKELLPYTASGVL